MSEVRSPKKAKKPAAKRRLSFADDYGDNLTEVTEVTNNHYSSNYQDGGRRPSDSGASASCCIISWRRIFFVRKVANDPRCCAASSEERGTTFYDQKGKRALLWTCATHVIVDVVPRKFAWMKSEGSRKGNFFLIGGSSAYPSAQNVRILIYKA